MDEKNIQWTRLAETKSFDEDCYLCGEDMSSSVFYIEPASLCKRCSVTYKDRFEITLSKENYQRITVPPMILFGFKGLEKGSNIISNIADIIHDDEECMNIDIDKYEFK